MEPHPTDNPRATAVDELVSELLVCAAAVNHLITGMIEYELIHGIPPGGAHLSEIAHSLVSGVAVERVHQSKRDLRVCAAIIKEIACAVQEDIFVVNPEAFPDAYLN